VFVLPGTSERVVLMDFGLARALERGAGSASGPAVVGTVDYMAPEQVEGKPATPSFDIYALGLVVFEMLTGCKPFAGETPLASAVERLTRRPPRPSDVVAGLHPTWDEIVARCLATDPAKRFASVDEIAIRLSSMASRWRVLGRGRMSALDAVIAGALVALVLLALRPSPSRDATPNAPAAPAPRLEATNPPPATSTAAPSASPAPASPSTRRAGPAGRARGPAAPTATARRDSTPTENRDELFAPRTVRPRHPDDVIDPFENQP
jgi:serine/threonine-protein kinase